MKALFPILSVTLLVGCATGPTAVSTPSGRPEVFIPNVTPEQMKPVIIDRELSKGWNLAQDTPYQVTFTRQANTVAAEISFGSQFNGIPNARALFTITSFQSGIALLRV